jgi:hypothetical protein
MDTVDKERDPGSRIAAERRISRHNIGVHAIVNSECKLIADVRQMCQFSDGLASLSQLASQRISCGQWHAIGGYHHRKRNGSQHVAPVNRSHC